MKEYTVKEVSSKTKDWSSANYGDFTTYYIRLEGEDDVIQISKKKDSEGPKPGDSLYGEIQDSEYGRKFKAGRNPNASGGGYSSKKAYSTKEMYVAYAKDVWVAIYNAKGKVSVDEFKQDLLDIKAGASVLMGEEVQEAQSGYEKAKAVAESLKNKDEIKQTADELFPE